MASVNAQIAARHEAARVAEQEDSCSPVFLRLGQPAKHVLLGPLLAALGELHEQVLDHGSNDVSGGEGVDADPVHTPFSGQIAAKLHHRGLGRVVGGADQSLQRKLLASCSKLLVEVG